MVEVLIISLILFWFLPHFQFLPTEVYSFKADVVRVGND